MTPDIWADYNQIDDDGSVVAYLEDVVRPERVVVGNIVSVADPEAKTHSAVVAAITQEGTIALNVDWSSDPTAAPARTASTA